MIDFDGDSTTITLASGQSTVDAQEIYSAWKDWAILGNNAAYLPAFRTIGGDPLGGGLLAGSFYFLQNQDGWRIKPPEEDIVVSITGNLFPENASQDLFSPTNGNFNTAIRQLVSSLTQVVEVNTGSGVTQSDIDEITASVVAGVGTVNVEGATIDTASLAKQINRSVQAAIPSPPSSSAIWDAAPKWLKKPVKQKDYSDEIRSLSNKLESLYKSMQEARVESAGRSQEAIVDPRLQQQIQEVAERIDAIKIPDGEESIAPLRSMVESLQAELGDAKEAIDVVRKNISELPKEFPQVDLSNLATAEELSALKSLVGKLSNYNDEQVISMLTGIMNESESISSQSSAIDQKVDLVLDNQLLG